MKNLQEELLILITLTTAIQHSLNSCLKGNQINQITKRLSHCKLIPVHQLQYSPPGDCFIRKLILANPIYNKFFFIFTPPIQIMNHEYMVQLGYLTSVESHALCPAQARRPRFHLPTFSIQYSHSYFILQSLGLD